MVNSPHIKSDPVYGMIILLLSKGSYASAIAEQLGKKRPAIVKRIRALERQEYIQRGMRSVPQFYNLTPDGISLLEHHKVTTLSQSGGHKVTTSEKFSDKQRLHAARFQLPHVTPMPLDIPDMIMVFRDYPVKQFRLTSEKLGKNHWNQYKITGFQNFTVYINRKVTEIRGIQVYADLYTSTSDILYEAVSKFVPFIEDIEELIKSRLPRFRFRKTARGVYEILLPKKEIAQEGDPFAQRQGKNKTKWIVYDPEDRKPRFTVDGSPAKLGHGKDIKEIEALHNKKALTDNEKLRIMKLDAGKTNWDSLTSEIEPETMGNMLVDLGEEKWRYDLDHLNAKRALALNALLSEKVNELASLQKEDREMMSQVLNTLLRIETIVLHEMSRREEL